VAARLKVDENLPDEIAELFLRHGHDAVTVADQGWEGLPDDELWRGIQAEGRWLVTADKGFADLRRFPPGAHAGVILLRLARQNRRDYSLLAETLLMQVELDEVVGAVIVVNERGVRVRRAPST
jgi:predicted nuclease of predicted toxin-antitoxin system